MKSTTPRRLLGRAYITCAVRYAAPLYPSLLLGVVPMALSSFLQSSLLGSVEPSISPAGRNTCGSAPLWVAPLCTAVPSASMPAKTMLGVASLHNAVASACPFMK